MASATTAREADDSNGADTHLQVLMSHEFVTLTGFISRLLHHLTDAPPDWRAADTRFDTLQRLAMTREQLASGIALGSAISAAAGDKGRAGGHLVGFSSAQN